jgi:hypothetical protein
MRREDEVQKSVVNYLNLRYPEVWFKADMSGERMQGVAFKAKHSQAKLRGFPDMHIYPKNCIFGALFIEIKAETARLVKLDNTWASDHLKEQAAWVSHLNHCGHMATFGIGTEHCIQIIDALMHNQLEELSRLLVTTPDQARVYQDKKNTPWHQIQRQQQKQLRSKMSR